MTIGTILFPTLSRFAAQKNMDEFRETLSLGVRQMIYVSLPFLAWFTILAAPIVRLVYQRGTFTPPRLRKWRGRWPRSRWAYVRQREHHVQPQLPEPAAALAAALRRAREPRP